MHIEVVLAGEFSRLGRETVAARITPKPEAIAEALYVGKVNLAPGIAIWRVCHMLRSRLRRPFPES